MCRRFMALLRWELLSYLRNRSGLFWSALFPFVLLTVLLSAFGDGNNRPVRVGLIDHDAGAYAQEYANFLKDRPEGAVGAQVSITTQPGATNPGEINVVIPPGFSADAGGMTRQVAVNFDTNARAAARIALGVIADATNEFAWARVNAAPPIKIAAVPTMGSEKTIKYADYVMSGILVVSMLSTCVMGTILPIAARREGHLLKIFSVFPAPPAALMGAILVSRVALVFVFGATFLLGAHLLYGVGLPSSLGSWVSLVAVVGLGSITFLSMALAVASRVGNIQTATIVSNIIYMPLVLFSDLTVPLNNLPNAFQTISDNLPVHAFVETIRGILLSGDSIVQHGRALMVMAIWAVGFGLLGRRLFVLQNT
ncbi:MAG: ABC transporter permease [Pseudomonadota bacterium]